jgi:large subunit ribosomal protein L4
MPRLDIVDVNRTKVGEIDLADAVFGAEVKEHLLWEVVKAQRAGARAGTHDTKKRDEVRGGGKKPYRQKGTGNARQGSSRAPNHVGGGKVFGPHPRDYSQQVPRKVRRGALCSALSLRTRENRLLVLDAWPQSEPKTKQVVKLLLGLGAPSALVIDDKANLNLSRSLRNLGDAKFLPPEGLNVYDILRYPTLVVTAPSARAIEGRLLGARGAAVAGVLAAEAAVSEGGVS